MQRGKPFVWEFQLPSGGEILSLRWRRGFFRKRWNTSISVSGPLRLLHRSEQSPWRWREKAVRTGNYDDAVLFFPTGHQRHHSGNTNPFTPTEKPEVVSWLWKTEIFTMISKAPTKSSLLWQSGPLSLFQSSFSSSNVQAICSQATPSVWEVPPHQSPPPDSPALSVCLDNCKSPCRQIKCHFLLECFHESLFALFLSIQCWDNLQ